VDDILCIWTGGSAQAIELFLHEPNEFDLGINFSLEFGDQSINFLDLGIELKELYNLLISSVSIGKILSLGYLFTRNRCI